MEAQLFHAAAPSLWSLLIPPPASTYGCPVTDVVTERQRGKTHKPWAERDRAGLSHSLRAHPCVHSPEYHCAQMHKPGPWEIIISSLVASG